MKGLITTAIAFVLAASALGQSTNQNDALEQEIRHREQAQVDALLKNDIAAMKRNWAADYVVNNPMNEVVDASRGRIQAGNRTYSSFVRDIERVLVHDNTVIVMGQETVVPSGAASDAGKTIVRRFTNVWMMRDGQWLLTARQATVICKELDGGGAGRAEMEGPSLKTVHRFNVASGAAEAELLGALDEMNQVIAKEGYPQSRYRVWKVQGDQQGSHAYLWESTWPDRAAYAKVHDAQSYQRAFLHVRSAIEASVKDEVYNRYVEVPLATAKK